MNQMAIIKAVPEFLVILVGAKSWRTSILVLPVNFYMSESFFYPVIVFLADSSFCYFGLYVFIAMLPNGNFLIEICYF